ncbi:uncharacterized protein [Physcomitrium patens]|uniref:Uncharacterized protein n=1 Tax=Physcomitrium patens TaxID=3218 RepID=A0A2K1J2J4_PHYPA|nr:uncharacterized protein LOC112294561 [Physcomitrium patens]PNR35741.1 hypothetical protein PHYPA_021591 [Physcomitrium patens]|eukprot:XP_024400917.1 uncharacterized protein LOC112294561 [Physcomitrella patens]
MARIFAAVLTIASIIGKDVLPLALAQQEGFATQREYDRMFRNDVKATGVQRRTEWPELLHKNMSAVWALFWNTLDEADPDFSMFLQRPLPSEQNRPQHDEESDVWFYLTRDDIIYEIPRHGRWHPNRVCPGWPELKGVHYRDAVKIIKDDMPGVLVDYGPLRRRKPKGTQINRVVLYVDEEEKVARIPHVG